jgi:hypothetical protein
VWARKPWRLQPWRARWMEKSLDMENTNFFSRFGTHRPQHHSLPCMTLHTWPWKSLDSGGGCDHRQLKVLQQPQPRTSNDKWGAASVRSFIHITASMCQCGRWLVWCGIWRLRTHTRCLPTTCFAFAHFCPSLSQRHIQSFSCLSDMPTIMLCALRLWHPVYALPHSFSHAAIMNLPCPRTWI